MACGICFIFCGSEKTRTVNKSMGFPEKLRQQYNRHREVLLYLIFGGLAFVVSLLTFMVFYDVFGWNVLAANGLSWFLTVLFAFFTNRTWVFAGSGRSFLTQLCAFFGGRLFTLAVEDILLYVFISGMGVPEALVKTVSQIVVIVLNYGISKKWVF